MSLPVIGIAAQNVTFKIEVRLSPISDKYIEELTAGHFSVRWSKTSGGTSIDFLIALPMIFFNCTIDDRSFAIIKHEELIFAWNCDTDLFRIKHHLQNVNQMTRLRVLVQLNEPIGLHAA